MMATQKGQLMHDFDNMNRLANVMLENARENDVTLALIYFREGQGFITINADGDQLKQAIYFLIDHTRRLIDEADEE